MWDKSASHMNTQHSHQGTDTVRIAAGSLLSGNLAPEGWLASPNFVADTSGWMIRGDGSVEFSDGYFRGDISAATGTIGGWIINETSIADNATANDANVLIDSSNTLIRLGPTSGDYITLNGTNQEIESSNYVAGMAGTGFHLDSDLLEVANIACRGIIRTAVFQKDVVSAIGGSFAVLDADVLATDMTALDASTLTIEGNTTFAVDDILRIKDGTDDEWLVVTDISSAPTYVVTRDAGSDYSADDNPVWQKGASVINYGATGQGGIYMTASEANAPYLSVFTHAGSPWTTITTRLRVGNLNGYLDYVSDLYGIGIGETDNSLTYDPTNGLRITGTITGGIIQTTSSGNRIVLNGTQNTLAVINEGGPEVVQIQGALDTTIFRLNGAFTNYVISASSTATNSGVDLVYLAGWGTQSLLHLVSVSNVSRTKALLEITPISAQGAHIQLNPIATAPASPLEGNIYTDTDHFPYYCDNVAFRQFVLSGPDQTIAGIKTFSSFPVTPSELPTEDYQVTNKKYVADNFLEKIKMPVTPAPKTITSATKTEHISVQMVDADTAFAVWQDTTNDEIQFSKTTDGGANWSAESLVDGYVGEILYGQNWFYAANDQDLFVVHALAANELYLAVSSDGGANWGLSGKIENLGTIDVAHAAAIGGTDENNLFVVYLYKNSLAGSTEITYKFSKSGDGGSTWSTPVQVHTNAVNSGKQTGVCAAMKVFDVDNIWVALGTNSAPSTYGISWYSTDDGGDTWTSRGIGYENYNNATNCTLVAASTNAIYSIINDGSNKDLYKSTGGDFSKLADLALNGNSLYCPSDTILIIVGTDPAADDIRLQVYDTENNAIIFKATHNTSSNLYYSIAGISASEVVIGVARDASQNVYTTISKDSEMIFIPDLPVTWGADTKASVGGTLLYSKAGELYVLDSGGNETTLS